MMFRCSVEFQKRTRSGKLTDETQTSSWNKIPSQSNNIGLICTPYPLCLGLKWANKVFTSELQERDQCNIVSLLIREEVQAQSFLYSCNCICYNWVFFPLTSIKLRTDSRRKSQGPVPAHDLIIKFSVRITVTCGCDTIQPRFIKNQSRFHHANGVNVIPVPPSHLSTVTMHHSSLLFI